MVRQAFFFFNFFNRDSADAFKRLAGKAAEALPAIVGSVVGAILSFLGKAVGFLAEHTWALIVFVVGLIGVWLMQRVNKD